MYADDRLMNIAIIASVLIYIPGLGSKTVHLVHFLVLFYLKPWFIATPSTQLVTKTLNYTQETGIHETVSNTRTQLDKGYTPTTQLESKLDPGHSLTEHVDHQ